MSNFYDSLGRASKDLLINEPFYGVFLSGLNKRGNDKIPTACVTSNNINFELHVNEEFFLKLCKETRVGVLKHEMLHIVFFHLENFTRFPNKRLANIAMDLEINQYIENKWKGEDWMGLEYNKDLFVQYNLKPKQGSKYYYDILQKALDENPNQDGGGSGEGDQSQGNSDGNSNDPHKELRDLVNGPGTLDAHDLWKEFEKLSDAEKKLIQKQIDHRLKSVAEGMKGSPGNIPGELKEYIDKLFQTEDPVLDWKAYLRRFASRSSTTYTKKSRRKASKRFSGAAGIKIKNRNNTCVAIDTSGSVSQSELVEFFNELVHMHKTGTQITIIECDTSIGRIYDFDPKKPFEVTGRGGTDFEPVFDYIRKQGSHFSNLIYLTDGEAWAPETKIFQPTLWVHSSVSSINEGLPGMKIKINR